MNFKTVAQINTINKVRLTTLQELSKRQTSHQLAFVKLKL